MPAKRLPKKTQPGEKKKPWILQEPDAPEYEPLTLTCTGCGKQVEQHAHFCSECGTVFHQRDGSRPGKKPSSDGPDPDIAEFTERMDKAEKWTRAVCIAVGIFFLYVMARHLSFSAYGMLSALFLLGLAALCIARGIGGPGAGLDLLERLLPFGGGRWRR